MALQSSKISFRRQRSPWIRTLKAACFAASLVTYLLPNDVCCVCSRLSAAAEADIESVSLQRQQQRVLVGGRSEPMYTAADAKSPPVRSRRYRRGQRLGGGHLADHFRRYQARKGATMATINIDAGGGSGAIASGGSSGAIASGGGSSSGGSGGSGGGSGGNASEQRRPDLLSRRRFPPGGGLDTDHRHMQRALALAARGLGRTRPNPAVGCVVLDADGAVAGEGFHPRAGEPHAEVFALRAAGDRARGGTAYVTLEPCNHFGRTPPCTSALVAAGVRRVVAGMVDPDPRTAGGGLRRLAEEGMDVTLGVEGRACQRMNAPFVHRILHGRPYGILHCALSDDDGGGGDGGYGGVSGGWDGGIGLTMPPAHPDFATCDAVVVLGAEGAMRLATAAPELPATVFRVVVVGDAERDLAAPAAAAAVTALARQMPNATLVLAVGTAELTESVAAASPSGGVQTALAAAGVAVERLHCGSGSNHSGSGGGGDCGSSDTGRSSGEDPPPPSPGPTSVPGCVMTRLHQLGLLSIVWDLDLNGGGGGGDRDLAAVALVTGQVQRVCARVSGSGGNALSALRRLAGSDAVELLDADAVTDLFFPVGGGGGGNGDGGGSSNSSDGAGGSSDEGLTAAAPASAWALSASVAAGPAAAAEAAAAVLAAASIGVVALVPGAAGAAAVR
ncbi:unnamed protein product [Phaeothamnion confervicola]